MVLRPALCVVSVALVLVIGACSGGGSEGGLGRAPEAEPIPSTSPALSPSTSLLPTTTTLPTTTAPAPALVLAPDGLGAVRFGDDAGTVLDRLGAVFGAPTDDSPVESCPSGAADRLVQFSELAVTFAGQRFVAWDIGPTTGAFPAPLVTAEGIGVGSTISELRRAYASRLRLSPDDPFGPSFEIDVPPPGGLGGTLTGTSPTDTVATLKAGDTGCGG